MLLSIEWNSIRLAGPVYNNDQNYTKAARVTFCLSKTRPCAIISSQISFKFTREVVYYPILIPVNFNFWFQCCQLSRILGQNNVTNSRSFWSFDTGCQYLGIMSWINWPNIAGSESTKWYPGRFSTSNFGSCRRNNLPVCSCRVGSGWNSLVSYFLNQYFAIWMRSSNLDESIPHLTPSPMHN